MSSPTNAFNMTNKSRANNFLDEMKMFPPDSSSEIDVIDDINNDLQGPKSTKI